LFPIAVQLLGAHDVNADAVLVLLDPHHHRIGADEVLNASLFASDFFDAGFQESWVPE
jgi:hypothetical protein